MEIRSDIVQITRKEQKYLGGYPSRILLSQLSHFMEMNETNFYEAESLAEEARSGGSSRRDLKRAQKTIDMSDRRSEFFRQVVDLAVEQEFAGFDEKFGVCAPDQKVIRR